MLSLLVPTSPQKRAIFLVFSVVCVLLEFFFPKARYLLVLCLQCVLSKFSPRQETCSDRMFLSKCGAAACFVAWRVFSISIDLLLRWGAFPNSAVCWFSSSPNRSDFVELPLYLWLCVQRRIFAAQWSHLWF